MPSPLPLDMVVNENLNMRLTVPALLEELKKSFPRLRPQPSNTINEVMFSGGEQCVIDWIEERIKLDNPRM
jgi:hypothetical protein